MNEIFSMIQQSKCYAQFESFLKIRYPDEFSTFTITEKLDKFENIFMMGLRQAQKFHELKQSCDLLWGDKPPRADMVKKLGNILWELESISSYPVVPPLKIRAAIKKVLSSRDKRTQKRYLEWIIQYSHQKPQFNTVDLRELINRFPRNKIQQGDIW
jgi:hypothetical protein